MLRRLLIELMGNIIPSLVLNTYMHTSIMYLCKYVRTVFKGIYKIIILHPYLLLLT